MDVGLAARSGGVPYGSRADAGVTVSAVARRFDTVLAVDGLNLDVARHRRLGVVGPSGCGKSTLLAMICGLDEPDRGAISVLGGTTREDRLRSCAWMAQRDLLLPWRTAVGNACLPLENRGVTGRQARERVLPLFASLGLSGFEHYRPAQLSGGMRQRVAFARTVMADKDVLLLDEPFGALDSITRADLQTWLLHALDTDPRTVVLVTHDVEEAILLCHEVAVMSARPGRIVSRIPVTLPPTGSRRAMLATAEFIALREQILEELER
ncbi:MAG TPA: ABC transporter ATP-binding protein [Kineosporiaceae bacterium]|nr:ABC transporter ATP-binding protein [Kineosporiaceae bacterium]